MDIKTIKGIAIVSIKDGEKLGVVDTTLFSIDDQRIHSFRMAGGNVFGRSRGHVMMDNVSSIGTDAIMIPDRDSVTRDDDARRFEDFPTIESLGAKRVVTENGSYLGDVHTIRVDKKTGLMTFLEVSSGGFFAAFQQNLQIPMSDVLSVGRDVVVVPNSYASESSEEPDEQPGETPPENSDDTKRLFS